MGVFRGGEIDRQDDIEARKGASDKIELQPLLGKGLQQAVALAVEGGGDGGGPAPHYPVQHRRQQQHGGQGVPQQPAHILPVARAEAAAEDGLDPLSDSGVDGRHHQGEVGYHPIGRHPHVPLHGQQNPVEHQDHHPGGHLRDQGGHAAGEDPGGHRPAPPAPHQMEAIPPPEHMGGQDQHTDHRRQPRGQYRAKHPHAARKEEHIVQHHIGQAAPHHGGHGPLGRPVVADKGQQHVVEQKQGGKQQHHADIDPGHVKDAPVRPQQGHDPAGQQQARQQKAHRQPHSQANCVAENHVGLSPLPLALPDGKPDPAAHADHQTAAMDKAVYGDGQIEGGQSPAAQRVGNEKGIGQNVAGQPQHPQHVQGRILDKVMKTALISHKITCKKIGLCCTTQAYCTIKAPAGYPICSLYITRPPGKVNEGRPP